ncbi:MAG: flagellar hook-basal body complex protein [Phycisphaerales bacterium]
MNYGSHLATGGVLAAMRRMDVIANNLSNSTTTGYKPDFVIARERPAERVEGRSPFADPTAPPQEVLEKLGGGLRFEHDRIDLRDGPVERTGNQTDLALRGDGFFVLETKGGTRGRRNAPVEVTRSGATTVDKDGTLRSADNGRAYLAENGRPLVIDPTLDFLVDGAGRVYQEGEEVARLRVVRPTNPTSLEKVGGNVLRINGQSERVPETDFSVQQMALEESAADPVESMVELSRQARLMEANLRMIQYQDNLTGQAISGFSRTA